MKLSVNLFFYMLILVAISSCSSEQSLEVSVFETSKSGHKLTSINNFSDLEEKSIIVLNPEKKYQTITGFGGAFTESSAYLLNELSKKN